MPDHVYIDYRGPICSTNQAYRRSRAGGMFMSQAGKDFKAGVANAAKKAMGDRFMLSGPVAVEVVWFFKTKANDVDSASKLAIDALQGVALLNDRQIVYLAQTKRKADHPEQIGFAMTVTPVPNEEGAA